MNYEHAFTNMAKALLGDVQPSEIGHAPDSRPRSVKIANEISVGDSLRNGTIAGRLSGKLLDKRDHFPVLTQTQARSSMTRAMQLRAVPVWYGGSLDDLRKEVYEGIVKAHPDMVEFNVPVRADKALALSDGCSSPELTKDKIKDPNDIAKTQVPSVKRPTLTTAEELSILCEDDGMRNVIAGKLIDLIEAQEQQLADAKQIANKLTKKGLSSDDFSLLSTYLQSDILRELIFNESMATDASYELRRRELLDRLNEK